MAVDPTGVGAGRSLCCQADGLPAAEQILLLLD